MVVEIQMKDLLELYRLASLGKVIGGLVHNLNGPLQNLGLDIEMTNHLLTNVTPLGKNEINNILNRFKRMGEEFERIDQLIKVSSIKASSDENYFHFLHINEFLQQELMFNKNNLYFKHNVRLEFHLERNLPTFRDLSKDLILALSWFLHALIEELESQAIKVLSVKTCINESLEIVLNTKEGCLSNRFMDQLNQEIPESKPLNLKERDVEIILPLVLFKMARVSISGETRTSGSKIVLTIPINNPLS